MLTPEHLDAVHTALHRLLVQDEATGSLKATQINAVVSIISRELMLQRTGHVSRLYRALWYLFIDTPEPEAT